MKWVMLVTPADCEIEENPTAKPFLLKSEGGRDTAVFPSFDEAAWALSLLEQVPQSDGRHWGLTILPEMVGANIERLIDAIF